MLRALRRSLLKTSRERPSSEILAAGNFASSTPKKARGYITPQKSCAYCFRERSYQSANLQVQFPKTKQKIKIKTKEKVQNLKNEFAQTKFEGDSGKTKKQLKSDKMKLRKRKYKKCRKQRKAGKVPQVIEGGGIQVGTVRGQGGANRGPLRKNI